MTGGSTYDAGNEEELASVYRTIREKILQEYRVVYRALVAPSDRREVRIALAGTRAMSEQVYFSSTVFGLPSDRFGLLFLIPFLVGLALWWAVTQLRFTNRRKGANLEVLGGKTQIFPLEKGQTVIGPLESADVTVVNKGGSTGGAGEATVQFDKASETYTVVAPNDIRVNNRLTKKRKLEPGDVLNLDGTIVVFDEEKET
jgi:Ca-activated chloride channel family protein